MFLDQN